MRHNPPMTTPFEAMQLAVDIVNTSEHTTNKIAACLFGNGPDGTPFAVRAVNHWPTILTEKLGPDTGVGNTSGTVHAETACVLQAPVTAGASICITDPFCPNCAKNMAEAGIKHIYIDHKGFDKDFITRRVDDFTDLSLHIVERAGIAVSMIHRRDHKITPMITPSKNYIPPDDTPVSVIHPPAPEFNRDALVNLARAYAPAKRVMPYAAAFMRLPDHSLRVMIAEAHIIRGYSETSKSDRAELAELHTGKYTMVMEPVNRLMMAAARMGAKIDPRLVVSSRVPTSRELVNMVAGGYTNLHILDRRMARDVPSVNALEALVRGGVLEIK
jgi:deoxycytidylate deaminase